MDLEKREKDNKDIDIIEEICEESDSLDLYINGIFKKNVAKSAIADLPYFINNAAKAEGIESYQISINDQRINRSSLNTKKLGSINKIEINTFDAPR